MPRSTGILAVLALLASAGGVAADDFYRGKTIRMIVPSEAGGGYDYYGRTLAAFLRKHIPGEPNFIVQNMPGGGGLTSANWLYNVAPKDGLTIGLIQRGVPFYPYFGERNALYMPARFNWLGSFNSETGVTTMWHTAKVQTMEAAFTETAVLGGSGPNDSETYPLLMNNTIGTKFRVVAGYRANTAVLLAMERGEVEGVTGSWSSMKVERPDWLRDRKVSIIVQVARKKHADLPDVPLIMDYVRRPEDRAMWAVILAMATVGRPVSAPPGIPADLSKVLRTAFAATMQDPGFVAEMERTRRELTPETGETMQQLLEEVATTPPDILTRLNSYIRRN